MPGGLLVLFILILICSFPADSLPETSVKIAKYRLGRRRIRLSRREWREKAGKFRRGKKKGGMGSQDQNPRRWKAIGLSSVGVLIAFDGSIDGEEDHAEIQPQAPVLHIPDIVLDPFTQLLGLLDLSTEPIYLGPSCNAGFDEMADHVFFHEL